MHILKSLLRYLSVGTRAFRDYIGASCLPQLTYTIKSIVRVFNTELDDPFALIEHLYKRVSLAPGIGLIRNTKMHNTLARIITARSNEYSATVNTGCTEPQSLLFG